MRAVQEGFGLEDEEDPAAWLAEYAYGVRFECQTDGPGYVGPLYLLRGAGSPETRHIKKSCNGVHLACVESVRFVRGPIGKAGVFSR